MMNSNYKSLLIVLSDPGPFTNTEGVSHLTVNDNVDLNLNYK